MGALSTMLVFACAAAAPTGNDASQTNSSYDAVMHAQYAARSVPVPQRAEEAQRIYDAYLNSLGQKTKSKSENSSGGAGDTSR